MYYLRRKSKNKHHRTPPDDLFFYDKLGGTHQSVLNISEDKQNTTPKFPCVRKDVFLQDSFMPKKKLQRHIFPFKFRWQKGMLMVDYTNLAEKSGP